jgi:hypothetical protein
MSDLGPDFIQSEIGESRGEVGQPAEVSGRILRSYRLDRQLQRCTDGGRSAVVGSDRGLSAGACPREKATLPENRAKNKLH